MKTQVNFTWPCVLIYHLASFFGLVPFTLRNNNLYPNGAVRKAYALIVVIFSANWTVHLLNSRKVRELKANFLDKSVFVIYSTLLMGSVISILFIFAFKSNRAIDIYCRIIAIKKELSDLAIDDNHEKNRVKFYARIIAANCVSFLIQVTLITAYITDTRKTELIPIYWIGSTMRSVVSFNAILIFAEAMICFRQLFESLNNKLDPEDEFLSYCVHSDSEENEAHDDQGVTADRAPQRVVIDDVSENCHLSVEIIEGIGKLHGELRHLAESTTSLFTVPIIFAILMHFARLVGGTYSTYMNLINSYHALETKETIIPFVRPLVVWTIIALFEWFLIADACTSICRVGNATKMTLHRAWNKSLPDELRNQFFVSSVKLMREPITISAFGFFNLDYSFMFQILYAMLAYFIMMIQLDTSSQPSPNA